MERRERAAWAVGSAGVFSSLEAAVGLLHPAQGLAYHWLDLPVSLLGWCGLALVLALARHGERLAGAVLLALVLPVLLGSAWWALLGLLALGVPRVALGSFGLLGLASGLLHPRAEAPRSRHPELPGLMLITVDTLRADHLGQLGLQPALLESGVSAVSAAPWTLPAMDSIMLGQSALEHGGGQLRSGGYSRPEGQYLAERLQERGYVSSAWVCNPHLRAEMGFDRGFDSFVHADSWRDPALLRGLIDERVHLWGGPVPRLWRARDAALIALVRAELEQDLGGRFLWLHVLGPHEFQRDPVSASQDPSVLYRLAVARSGDQLEPLLSEIPDGVRVLMLSDHGESLGEEGRWGHGTALVDEQLLVPVLAMGDGVPVLPELLPAWTLPGVVLLETPVPSPGPVEVGGVRRDPQAAALRSVQGYQPIQASATDRLRTVDPNPWRDQLHALGYQDLEQDRESNAEPIP